MVEDFVLEYPLGPDVHAGVAAGRPGQVRAQIDRERPDEREGHHDVARQRDGVQRRCDENIRNCEPRQDKRAPGKDQGLTT